MIIHNGIFLDLVCGFGGSVRSFLLLFSLSGILPSYIVFLRRHVVPLENPYFLPFLRRFVR